MPRRSVWWLLLLLMPRAAMAYDESGHFYSVAFAALRALPHLDRRQGNLIARCTQLPDESCELDAVLAFNNAFRTTWRCDTNGVLSSNVITNGILSLPSFLAWSAGTWWRESVLPTSPEVAHMIAVQQLLHGLSGGKSELVQRIAQDSVDALVTTIREQQPSPSGDSLCALGFALHLMGDTFAHRRLREQTAGYPTGMGHAGDKHYPDYLQFASLNTPNLRQDWTTYVRTVAQHLAPIGGPPDLTVIDGLVARMPSHDNPVLPPPLPLNGACADFDGDPWDDEANAIMRDELGPAADALGRPADLACAIDHYPYTTCQDWMNRSVALAQRGDPQAPKGCRASCGGSWRAFKNAVVQKYLEPRNAGARDTLYKDFGAAVAYADPDFKDDDPTASDERCADLPPTSPPPSRSPAPSVDSPMTLTPTAAIASTPPTPKTTSPPPSMVAHTPPAGTPSATGTPTVATSTQTPTRRATTDIKSERAPAELRAWHFSTDCATVGSSGEGSAVFDPVLSFLISTNATRVTIVGHADTRGSHPHNDHLAAARACAAYRYLMGHGVAPEQISIAACGKRYPLPCTDTLTACQDRDRRVEFEPSPYAPLPDCVALDAIRCTRLLRRFTPCASAD